MRRRLIIVLALSTASAALWWIVIRPNMGVNLYAGDHELFLSDSSNTNPGFEDIQDNRLAGWNADSIGKAVWTSTDEVAHSGRRSVRLTGVPDGTLSDSLFSNPIHVHQGDLLRIGLWIKGYAVPDVHLESVIGGTLKAIGGFSLHFAGKDSAGWSNLQCSVVVPEGFDHVRLRINERWHGDWYLDDFECRVSSLTEDFAGYCDVQKGKAPLPDTGLFVFDALNASYLASYGGKKAYTPNIDTLAREGVRYEKACTVASWTLPSFASLFSSVFPAEHKVIGLDGCIPEEVVTLATVMKTRGYFTVAFTLTAADGFLGADRGFGRGFDKYFSARDEGELLYLAKAWLDANATNLSGLKGGGIFFLFHFFETHAPYVNHNIVTLSPHGRLSPESIAPESVKEIFGEKQSVTATSEEVEYVRDCYASEVSWVDRNFGELLQRFKSVGMYDDMNMIVTADHGESLGEKAGLWMHSHPYFSCMKVPLIVRFPGMRNGGTVERDALVSTLDIMPTLLAQAGAEIPAACRGRDLFANTSPPEYLFCVSPGTMSAFDGVYHFIIRTEEQLAGNQPTQVVPAVTGQGMLELYDIENDPYELNNIVDLKRDVAERFKLVLIENKNQTRSESSPSRIPSLSPETIDTLKSQGYL